MGQVKDEKLLTILTAGNSFLTGNDIIQNLNEAGYYIAKVSATDIHRGTCPTCGCKYVEGQIVKL